MDKENRISGIDWKKRFSVEVVKNKKKKDTIKDSLAAKEIEVAPLPLPDPGLLRLSGSRSQIA